MQLIYGMNPLREALLQEETPVERLFVRRGTNAAVLEKLAHAKSIPVEVKDGVFFARLLENLPHQGVAGVMRDFQYTPLEAILTAVAPRSHATVIILDEITDPQNLGAIIRVAHCGGADGVIIPARRACPITPAVLKASAGAAFFTQISQVGNIAMAMEQIKDAGFWLYGAEADAARDIAEVAFAEKTALIMGSEGQGMRRIVAQKCDVLFSLPLRGRVGSLNVAVATGIALYELKRRVGEA